MATTHDAMLFAYNLAIIPVVFMSILFLIMAMIAIFIGKTKNKKYKQQAEIPFVSVQIPTYNDPIAKRCIEHCMKFDYPKDKYEIIIVDDSTNIETQNILKEFAEKNTDFIKYIHRDNREGYKPGALKNAMKITKGEIIVIFDSDWVPKRDFLKTVVEPFSDPKVAIVQTRQGFLNLKTNIISRFSGYLLMIYHTIIMPINNETNTVFFCGTAGAIRRKAMERVGGWNINSLTEDSDLSVRILAKGYKSVYLTYETPSEVPDTLESFIKQQMRWTYGAVRVFFDNIRSILFSKKLSIEQRFMISFMTLLNFAAPVVLIMTLFGFMGWFTGEPTLMTFNDAMSFLSKFGIAAGYLIMGGLALYKQKKFREEFFHFVKSLFTIAIVLLVSNTYATVLATLKKRLPWFCTPKIGNAKFTPKD